MKIIHLTLFLLAFNSSFAQNWVDLANVYWRVSPANSIENFSEKRNMNMYVMDAKAPVVLGDKNILIFGVEYQHTTITSQSPFFRNYSFASSMLQIGWEHKWNDKSKTMFMAIPRFNTDYNNVDLNHFQLGGLVLGTTARNENFDWKYGLYYNGELFGPMIVPLFGFNWKINEKWRFKMVIPLNLELSYQPKEWFRTGLRFDGVNGSYMYRSPWNIAVSDTYIDKADNNAWAFAEFHLGKNVWFHMKAGHSVLRKYRNFSQGDKMNLKLGPVNIGDDRNWGAPENVPIFFKNGFSFEARFIYRLPIN